MQFQFIPYIIPLTISALIVLSLAYYGYKHRKVRGSKAFVINMLIGALWAVANAFEMAGVDLATKLFWANVQYIVYGFAPVVWLVMVLQFTDKAKWINKRNILLMSIIPVITIILVWTDQFHGLVRQNITLVITEGSFPVIDKDYGFWFWVHFSYSYLLNFSTVIFLFRTTWRKNEIYRKQASYLLLGFLVLMGSNFLYVTGLSPVKNFDLSPIAISITGLIIAWGIFHFRLFDLVPIARETVIEKMGSGIIVIDKMDRIIDINPQAKKMLKLVGKTVIGEKMSSISKELNKLAAELKSSNLNQREFSYQKNKKVYYFDIYSSPIRDYREEQVAQVLIINDITDLKEAKKQIDLQKQKLAVKEERERMARDLHDNLGQVLSFSSVQAQAVRQQIKKGNSKLADDYLKRLKQIIQKAHKEVREYVYNIRDDQHLQKNFSKILEDEVDEFKKNCDLDIKLDYQDQPTNKSLGIEEKKQLMLIVREALTNILKYAQAQRAEVKLKNNTDYIKLYIKDNGQGIDPKEKKKGSGISIMRERTRLIGGNFKIESYANQGTTVSIKLPKND